MRNGIISMLVGPDCAGKTVAATNVFCAMTMGGGIVTADKSVRFELVANDGWDIEEFHEQYVAMLDGKQLPIGTTENRSYGFNFQINGTKPEYPILYMDYRGGILNDRDSLANEIEEFDYMLANSNLLVYIIPGNILNDYIMLNGKGREQLATMTSEERKRFLRVSNSTNHLSTVMKRLKEQDASYNAPLLYYVTKADLVTGGREKLISGLKRLINEYGLRKGRPVLGCYSTLGWDVDIEEIRPNVRKIQSGFDPYGFEVPMMLTVGYSLSQAGKAWAKEEVKRLEQNIKYCEQRALDAKTEEKSIASQKNTFWQSVAFWNKRKREEAKQEAMKEQRRKADDAMSEKNRIQQEKNDLDKRNQDRLSSERILKYLEEEHSGDILYLDENGIEKPLSEFFR